MDFRQQTIKTNVLEPALVLVFFKSYLSQNKEINIKGFEVDETILETQRIF